MSARVVGLDLSLTATGVCAADGSTYTINPASKGDERLVEISAAVAVHTRAADLVVIEDAVVRSSAAVAIGMVHGITRLILRTKYTRYVLIPPASLKRFATGKGNAGKPEMAVALFKRAGEELPDDNQVDAWWLRAAGHELLGEPLVELPAAQVAALDKVRAAMGGESRA